MLLTINSSCWCFLLGYEILGFRALGSSSISLLHSFYNNWSLSSPEFCLCVNSGMESSPFEWVISTNFTKLPWNIHVLSKLWVIWSKITKTTLKLLFISLALLKISCTAGKVIMTLFLVLSSSTALSSCLFCYRWSVLLHCLFLSFHCVLLGFFCGFFFFPFSVWVVILSIYSPLPPSFMAPEYLCLIQCLIIIRKPVIFCEES